VYQPPRGTVLPNQLAAARRLAVLHVRVPRNEIPPTLQASRPDLHGHAPARQLVHLSATTGCRRAWRTGRPLLARLLTQPGRMFPIDKQRLLLTFCSFPILAAPALVCLSVTRRRERACEQSTRRQSEGEGGGASGWSRYPARARPGSPISLS
jgi:hypothetical protein